MENIQFQLKSKHCNRPFLADASFRNDKKAKPVIVFNHGFKGYKDWGPFNMMAQNFAENEYVFIKMNFAYNGTTIVRPTDFADLEAFGNNNFSKELDDTGVLIDELFCGNIPIDRANLDLNSLFIIGHSRGGSSAILKANEDTRIKKVVTWSAVSNLKTQYSLDELEMWKELGTIYIHNSRTNQQMPMHYQIVEDFYQHEQRLDVPNAVKKMKTPMLAIHGTNDETVPISHLQDFQRWNSEIEVKIIEGANHTFGGKEPFEESELPQDLREVVNATIDFFNQ